MKNTLLIFIKNPQLGKVKTRLAKTMGDAAALEIYNELTRITRHNAEILRGGNCHLFYSDYVDLNDAWSNELFEKSVQATGDLGNRMATAFHQVFAKNQERAVIIGSDCPTLTVEILEKAFQELENHDFVVGPSTDGGYYLLGIRASVAFDLVFENMAWSTDAVLPTTLSKITEGGYSHFLLPALTDVDEEKDWRAYLSTNFSTPC
jgi:uncharacterized protein